mmetsp:Transcript_6825/g.11512  ORF Transcript_6825/g.11512 Transcript_6825/m.11512 type:complete len:389 (-) Transcript_6825:66-1232(-)
MHVGHVSHWWSSGEGVLGGPLTTELDVVLVEQVECLSLAYRSLTLVLSLGRRLLAPLWPVDLVLILRHAEGRALGLLLHQLHPVGGGGVLRAVVVLLDVHARGRGFEGGIEVGGLRGDLVGLEGLVLVVEVEVHLEGVGLADGLALVQLLQQGPGVGLAHLPIAGQILALVLHVDDVLHLDVEGLDGELELVEIELAVAGAFNSADHCNELIIAGVDAVLREEAVEVEVADLSLLLAVNEVESGLHVPVRAAYERAFQHFLLQMEVDFPLEVVSHGPLHRGVQLLACFYVHLVGLPLAGVGPQLGVVARKDELHEFVVTQTPAAVHIVELEHQLAVLYAELSAVVFLQEVIEVNAEYLLVPIGVDPAEGRVGLKVVERRKLLSVHLNV